jgi:hypothetical protein
MNVLGVVPQDGRSDNLPPATTGINCNSRELMFFRHDGWDGTIKAFDGDFPLGGNINSNEMHPSGLHHKHVTAR